VDTIDKYSIEHNLRGVPRSVLGKGVMI
jgi:hypothetical protein